MRIKLLACLFLICLSVAAPAQETGIDKTDVVLPDYVMRQVVRGVMLREFKPARVKKTIPVLGQLVKQEWLPTISSLSFTIIPEADAPKYPKGFFLIKPIEKKAKSYSVMVGWGDNCVATGTVWEFQVVNKKVRSWHWNGHWGSGCGSSS